jgi:hypothetical protein
MADWFRSLTALGAAFIGVAVVTFGLAGIIVPGRAPAAQTDDDGATGSPAATAAALEGIGGDLAVSGDREGTLSLRRESQGEVYALVGDDARMVVAGRPAVISQISWDGLEFFPDPADCTITPGALDDRIGVGYADVRCDGLEDIRGGGTVSLAGRLGLPLNMVGEADLPEVGGSIEVGDETWSFAEAYLFEFAVNSGPGTEGYNLTLADEGAGGALRFEYDVFTHALGLAQVERGGEAVAASEVACSLSTEELGRIAPSVAIVELTINCPAAEVPGIGTVPIRGTVVVQQVGFTG